MVQSKADKDAQRNSIRDDLRLLQEVSGRIMAALTPPSSNPLEKTDVKLVDQVRQRVQGLDATLVETSIYMHKSRSTQGRSQAKKQINGWIKSATGPGVVVTVTDLRHLLEQI